jgi:hypothetical protein
MSGAAAVCSASVINTVRSSIQLLAIPWSANAAATIRLLTTSPTAWTASRERGDTSRSTDSACTRPFSSSNSRFTSSSTFARLALVTAAATERCRSSSAFTSAAALSDAPSSASWAIATSASVTFASADTTTTGALFVFACCGRTMPIAVDRVGIRHHVPLNFITTLIATPFR